MAATYIFLAFARAAGAGELDDRMAYWESQALTCPAGADYIASPAKQPEGAPPPPCGDGDMTLFNGLLCAAGDERGCAAVADAQNPVTGEWFRSPRLRSLGTYSGATFSPDMALGVQLYLIKKKDAVRGEKWLKWIMDNNPCYFKICGYCVYLDFPSFCPTPNCAVRPGDAAVLAETVNYLQTAAGMPQLPKSNLKKYLKGMSGKAPLIDAINAMVNQEGYSEHLTGVSILVSQLAGRTDPELKAAAAILALRNPGNAFFSYISGGDKDQLLAETLARCPFSTDPSTPPLIQWQYERANGEQAWKNSCYWDCVFMGKIIQGM